MASSNVKRELTSLPARNSPVRLNVVDFRTSTNSPKPHLIASAFGTIQTNEIQDDNIRNEIESKVQLPVLSPTIPVGNDRKELSNKLTIASPYLPIDDMATSFMTMINEVGRVTPDIVSSRIYPFTTVKEILTINTPSPSSFPWLLRKDLLECVDTDQESCAQEPLSTNLDGNDDLPIMRPSKEPVPTSSMKNFDKIINHLLSVDDSDEIIIDLGSSNRETVVKKYLEKAESEKRNYRYAKRLFQKLTEVFSSFHEVSFEYSKFEEEFGHFKESLAILLAGLDIHHHHMGLLNRLLKIEAKIMFFDRKYDFCHSRRLLYDVFSCCIINHKIQSKASHDLYSATSQQPPIACGCTFEKCWRLFIDFMNYSCCDNPESMFIYISTICPVNAPLAMEYSKYLLRDRRPIEALQVVEKFISVVSLTKFSPIWFFYMSYFMKSFTPDFRQLCVSNFIRNKEILWKFFLEFSVSSSSLLTPSECQNPVISSNCRSSRLSFAIALLLAPRNLKFRVLLSAHRFLHLPMLSSTHYPSAALLTTINHVFRFAMLLTSSKNHFVITCEELKWRDLLLPNSCGTAPGASLHSIATKNTDEGFLRQQLLNSYHKLELQYPFEWKIGLEEVNFLCRRSFDDIDYHGRNMHILSKLDTLLGEFPSVSRIWGCKIQFLHRCLSTNEYPTVYRDEANLYGTLLETSIQDSLKKFENLKSGEYWLEVARVHMNPLLTSTCSSTLKFDLIVAGKLLNFASYFTPQYGDVIVERIRYEILVQLFVPKSLLKFMRRNNIKVNYSMFVTLYLALMGFDSSDELCAETINMDHITNVYDHLTSDGKNETSMCQLSQEDNSLVSMLDIMSLVNLSHLAKQSHECNYGTIWNMIRKNFDHLNRPIIPVSNQLSTPSMHWEFDFAGYLMCHNMSALSQIYMKSIDQFVEMSLTSELSFPLVAINDQRHVESRQLEEIHVDEGDYFMFNNKVLLEINRNPLLFDFVFGLSSFNSLVCVRPGMGDVSHSLKCFLLFSNELM